MKKTRIAVAAVLILAGGIALALGPNQTMSAYKPTNGSAGSVAGTVILQSEDGYNAIPINPTHPLPVEVIGSGGGGPVTIADGADVAEGARADAAWSGSGSGTVVAILKAIWTKLTSDPATATNQTTTNTDLGPPGATACATDTGSCSLNALLQRIAQRITSVISDTTSILSGTGATGDAAATAGSTGSLSAKQRLMTSQLDSIKTSVELTDDTVAAPGSAPTKLQGVMCAGSTTAPLTSDTQVKASAGHLCGFFVNTSTACVMTIWNNTSATGTKIIDSFPVPSLGWHAAPFPAGTGLYFDVVTGTCSVTVAYN